MGTLIGIIGLVLATAVTILDKLTEEITKQKKWLRELWFILVIAGLAASILGAWWGSRDAAQQATAYNSAIGDLTSSVQKIPDNSSQFQQIESDLNLLIAHSGIQQPTIRLAERAPVQTEYLVQIAASTSRNALEPFLANLQKRFGSSTDAAILSPRPGSKQYLLVWGQHLDQASAKQRALAADTLHLPPPGQPAVVATQY